MHVEDFKLIDDGFNGILVIGKDSKQKGKYTVYVDATLKFKVPMPKDLVAIVQRLKIFMMQLTGHWEERYAKYLDEHYGLKDEGLIEEDYLRAVWLFDSFTVTGLKADNGTYIIKGKIKNTYGQTIGFATPRVSYESNYTSFEHLVKVASEVINVVEEYVNERKLSMMDSKQYLLELFKDAEIDDLTVIESMTEEETMEKQIEDLSNKGCFIFNPKDLEDVREEEKEEVFVKSEEDIHLEGEKKKDEKSPVAGKDAILPKKKSSAPKKAPANKKKEKAVVKDTDGF